MEFRKSENDIFSLIQKEKYWQKTSQEMFWEQGFRPPLLEHLLRPLGRY